MSTALMSGRLVFMTMVFTIALLTTVTSMELRISLSRPVGKGLIDPNHLSQAPLSLLRQLMRVPLLLQARARRGKEKLWLPEPPQQLIVQLLRKEEGMLHIEELIIMCLRDLGPIYLILMWFLHDLLRKLLY